MAHRLPPLSALRPFEAAARLESFTRAAGELHLTHGAVSHQVRALEQHLGTALFIRHGKRVALTSAGRAFAERVRGALAEIAHAADALRGGRRDNRLTLSVIPSFASRWLMPRLARFMDAHSDIEVNVIASTGFANFAADEVDLAIRFGKGPYPPLMSELLLEDEYFPVASPRFNKGRLPRAPRDLLTAPILREDDDYWQCWFEAAGVPVEGGMRKPRLLYNDSTFMLQAAARGEGIALGRRSIVEEDLERGALKRLFDVSVASTERYWLVGPREKFELAKVQAFREWLKAELSPRQATLAPRTRVRRRP